MITPAPKRHSAALEIEALRYLTAAAESDNFAHAAELLGVQPSTVSRSVAESEDKLGVTIFEKGHFGIRLTSAGRAVMVQVRRVLTDLEALQTVCRRSAAANFGEIHLGVCMPPIGFPLQPLLSGWLAKHQNVNLVLHEHNERHVLLAIEERNLDVALMTRNMVWPGAVLQPIYRERIMLAVPKGHRLAAAKKLGWHQIREETVLVQGWDDSQSAREFFTSFLGKDANYRAHAASHETIMALVGAGYGVTLVTKSQSEARYPSVKYRPIAEEDAWMEVGLVWAAENKEPVVGRFVAFMRDEAKSQSLL